MWSAISGSRTTLRDFGKLGISAIQGGSELPVFRALRLSGWSSRRQNSFRIGEVACMRKKASRAHWEQRYNPFDPNVGLIENYLPRSLK
jgi:hypothetical protein